jgi:hypothetical protein
MCFCMTRRFGRVEGHSWDLILPFQLADQGVEACMHAADSYRS